MAAHSPLAMLLLVTPYTMVYLANQLLLQGVLDTTHFVLFEFIFIMAFGKVFGLPDLSERLFPAQVGVRSVEAVRLVKTSVAEGQGEGTTTKKKVKKSTRKTPGSGTTTTTTTTTTTKKVKKEQPYAKELVAMEKKFMDYVENKDIWEKVHEENTRGMIEVYQYKARPMCYKVISVMNNTPEATFDLMSEIERRIEWDPLCEEAKTIASVSPGVKLLYMRTKGIWPTASRDTLVLGTIKKVGEDSYLNVTTSIEHPLMPPRTQEKFVRMETAVAGQIFMPEPGQPNKCRVIQVLDADLKGWIPASLVQMVSTKAVPGGIRRVNKMLPKIEPYTESKLLKLVEDLKQAGDDAQDSGSDQVVVVGGDEDTTSSHELRSKHGSGLIPSDLSEPANHGSGAYNRGSIERRRSSPFRAFWHGIKQSFNYNGTPTKANKVLVMTLVLAVLGPTFARFRRRQRR